MEQILETLSLYYHPVWVITAVVGILLYVVFKTDLLVYIMVTKYRWIITCFFLLPLSVFFDCIWFLQHSFRRYAISTEEEHNKRVEYVCKQVRDWNATKQDKKMCTARGSESMSPRISIYKKNLNRINIPLNSIVHLDEENRRIRVEPQANMGQISAYLIPRGWTLAVTPELDDLTVGGLLMGFGIETSSHIYGLFQHICYRYEVILADGSTVFASKDENTELFYALPWSHGTLGFLASAELMIVPCKKYVHVEYTPFKEKKAYVDAFIKASHNPENGFVEMLTYSPDDAVLMIANFVDEPKGPVNSIGLWYKPWFYTHVAEFLKTGRYEEYIPLRDYYHRHTKSLFWELEDIIPFGNHILFRLFFGWMVPPKINLLKLTRTKALTKLYEDNHVIQDMIIPVSKLDAGLELMDDVWKVYPIWLCPCRIFPTEMRGFVNPASDGEEMYVDVGIYGVPKAKNFHPAKTHKIIEKFVRDTDGYQALYADTYMTPAEFEEMFDHTLYKKLRKQNNNEKAFPDVYTKVNKNARE